jgi:glycosyltransferase involved in cell wall biosynthesis
MTAGPLVSCIMPTRNRPRFVGQSIWYFLRQDYANRELVIVDDGEQAVTDLVPPDERIRYIRLDRRTSIGEKRNIACAAARGELIAHWDDDDWIGFDRLSHQAAALGDGDICGATSLLHYRLEAGEAWLRSLPDNPVPELAGGTLFYRRSVWVNCAYSEVDAGDDVPLVASTNTTARRVLADAPFYVALMHAGATSRHDLGTAGWERRPVEEVSARIGFDREFYAALRSGTGGRATVAAPSRVASVTVASPFLLYDGYGSMAEYLVLGLVRAGTDVNVVPLAIDPTGLSSEFRAILARSRPEVGAPTLYFSWPERDLDRYRSGGDFFINTMWESSRLPAEWPERLNRARALIVPSRYVARVCRASGVQTPIEVIPEGLDPDVYHYEPRPDRAGLTTLVVGTLVGRKNADVAIAAWRKAFENDPEARLVIKARFGYGAFDPGDPRIVHVDSNETTRGIAHWYRQADVLLALGSEGFGLPLIEAMATGLPVVALDAAGQADVCEDARDLLLPVEARNWRTYDEPTFGQCGVFPAPDADDVADRLRWVADHREEAAAMGRAAAEWAPRARNVWDKAPAVLAVLEQRCQPTRPLRRVPTVWVPSLGTPCGVAETTARLLAELPGVRVSSTRPDLAAARVLHVQHEPSLFNDSELVRCFEEAAAMRVATAVTEHGVLPQAHAWERDATLLATTTGTGVAALRARWPEKWIEHLPLGCPTWFPPRKRRRGRVIAAFGFLERHKGFWQLLDVLRSVPGTRLLLFSYAKTPDLEREFEAAAAGLPVERVADFLPTEDIARRLAAEADALAFWYDAPPYPTASAAARVGLATGVPVLTSPTGWFADLQEVTYQPSDLVDGVSLLLEDTQLRGRLTAAAHDFCNDQSYARCAERHRTLWQTLEGI